MGGPTHPVLQLLLDRSREGSRPGRRNDPHRLALVIEGGGMRGVVSAGMAAALESLDALPYFDVIYGSSAGGMNGAYFVAGQAAFGMSIYYENLNDRRFIDFARYFTARPMLSLDYLLEEVVKREKALDCEKILQSGIARRVVASALARHETVAVGEFRDSDHLFTALRASATIPLVAGMPVKLDGDELVDAILSEPIPFKTAVDEGCTHLLCLLTRPRGDRPDSPTFYDRWIQGPRLARIDPQLADTYLRRPVEYAAEVASVWNATDHPGRAPFMCGVAPSARRPTVGRLEKSSDRLFAAGNEGLRAMADALRG